MDEERARRQQELAAARKEGETDALLRDHSEHLAKINGSVADTARSLAALTDEVRDRSVRGERALRDAQYELKDEIRAVVGEIRTLQEELRIRDERVATAKTTLADETERRRHDLELSTESARFRFTKWHGIALVAIAVAGLILAHPWA